MAAGKETIEMPTPVAAKNGNNKRLLVIMVVGLALLAAVFVGRMVMGGSKTAAPLPPVTAAAPGPTPGGGAGPAVAAAPKPAVQPGPPPNTTRDPFKPLR